MCVCVCVFGNVSHLCLVWKQHKRRVKTAIIHVALMDRLAEGLATKLWPAELAQVRRSESLASI